MVDFAVDVRPADPPSWLVERLAKRLDGLGRYPGLAGEAVPDILVLRSLTSSVEAMREVIR